MNLNACEITNALQHFKLVQKLYQNFSIPSLRFHFGLIL